MQKLLLTLGLFSGSSILGMSEEDHYKHLDRVERYAEARIQEEQKIIADEKKHEAEVLARVKSRYKSGNTGDISRKLIEQGKYGQELADLLDVEFAVAEYRYKGNGLYSHARGPAVHSYPRHMCEGVTEEQAEKAHYKQETPSFVSPDGTRHYAFPH